MLKRKRIRGPDFIGIGAPKSGTTALVRILGTHPQISIPMKEPRYFISERRKHGYIPRCTRDYEAYLSLFSEAPESLIMGEFSTDYLADADTPSLIADKFPKIKLLALLRNPADRAFSHFVMDLRGGAKFQREDFRNYALFQGAKSRIPAGVWETYISLGYYGQQLSRYFDFFPKHQILVEWYEDFLQSPEVVVARIVKFLGADSTLPMSCQMNSRPNQGRLPSGVPAKIFHEVIVKHNLVKVLLRPFIPISLRRRIMASAGAVVSEGSEWMGWRRPKGLDSDVRNALLRHYESDILLLEKILGRQAANWLR